MTGIRVKHACLLLLLFANLASAGEAKLAEVASAAGMEAYPVPLKAPAFRLPALQRGIPLAGAAAGGDGRGAVHGAGGGGARWR